MQIFSATSKRVALSAILGAVAFQSLATISYADGKQNYYIQEAEKLFYGTTTNAKQAGVAGATNVTSKDSSSVVNNPAGMGLNQNGDASLTYGHDQTNGNQDSDSAKVNSNSNLGQALVIVPLAPTLDGTPDYGSLGLGWSGIHSGSTDSINTDDNIGRVHAAYGIEVSDGVSLGYGLTYIASKQITGVSKFDKMDGFRHTFGAQMEDGNLTTGADFYFGTGKYDLRGANSDLTYSYGNSDYHEDGVDLGAAYKVADATTVSAAVGYQSYDVNGEFIRGASDTFIGGNEGGDFFDLRIGAEQALSDVFAARVGYSYIGRSNYFFGREDIRENNGSANANAFSAGIGASLPTGASYVPSINIDYAAEYRDISRGDWQQTITLSFPFSLCEAS